jgi:hypothetical protein
VSFVLVFRVVHHISWLSLYRPMQFCEVDILVDFFTCVKKMKTRRVKFSAGHEASFLRGRVRHGCFLAEPLLIAARVSS